MSAPRAILIWCCLVAGVAVPIAVAAGSEYLQYRSSIYVAAGFAGIFALAILMVQPLLASGGLPGVARSLARRVHRWAGATLVLAVALHVAGLWITSPPDMIDALTFSAPTVFSTLGVLAMWAVIVAALLAAVRKRLGVRPQIWRWTHTVAVTVVVTTSVAHALLIKGTMGPLSKTLMCLMVLGALAFAVRRQHPWTGLWRRDTDV